MNKQDAIMFAKQDMKMSKSDGYVIIGSSAYNYKGTVKYTEYDFEVFSCYEELTKFLQKKRAYNYLNFDAYLHDDEFIESAYSKSHLIIL